MDTTKTTSKKKVWLIILAVIAVIYIAGVIYFQNRFLPGTKIGDDKISGKTLAQVEQMLKDQTESYQLDLTGRKGFKAEIKGSDIDLVISMGDEIKAAMEEQSAFLWFLGAPEQTEALKADFDFKKDKLDKAIADLSCFKKANIIAPVNAKIVLKDGEYEIKKEVYGTTVDKKKLTAAIETAIAEIQPSLSLKEAKCYNDPTLYHDDPRLEKGIEQANKLADVTVTYDFSYTTEKVDSKMIKKWIVFDKECNAKLGYRKVLNYIEELADKYDTYSTVRTVKDAGGEEHKVYFGSYGWKISQTKEAKALMKVIKAGKDVTREPIYMYKAVCRKEGNIDWDDTYALVNLSNQSMCFIKDGKAVLSSSVVTGDVTKGRGTPTGAYQIMYKESDATLIGQDYSSPVRYWMPFTTNTGFHDASWRSSFGGSIYRGNGSHGCVNMPTGSAAALFSMIPTGTPVFVYEY